MATMKSNSQEPSQSQSQTQRSSLEHDGQAAKQPANNTKLNIGAQNVPTTFSDMFCFNAAVMGLDDRLWMYEVLKSFDAVVRNVASSNRLQEPMSCRIERSLFWQAQLLIFERAFQLLNEG